MQQRKYPFCGLSRHGSWAANITLRAARLPPVSNARSSRLSSIARKLFSFLKAYCKKPWFIAIP
jgi:hypothetical protein